MQLSGWRGTAGIAVAVVLLVTAASCGGGDGDDLTASLDTGTSDTQAGTEGAPAVLDGLTASRATAVAVDEGALFIGGVEMTGAEDGTFEVISRVTLVAIDGTAETLPAIPGGPVFVTDATHRDGMVYVAGVRCDEGQEVSDTGRVLCQPGDVVTAHLELAEARWTAVPAPAQVTAESGEVRGMSLASFGDYLVLTGPGAGRPSRWISRDEGLGWTEIPAVDGELCATADALLAIDVPGPDGQGVKPGPRPPEPVLPEPEGPVPSTFEGADRAAEPTTLVARTFDPAQMAWGEPVISPPVIAVAGSASGSCTASGSLHALVTRDGGALVSFTPDAGFAVAEDPSWGALLSVIPTTGPLAVVLGLGDMAVVIDQSAPDLDARLLDGLPAASSQTVGIGGNHLLSFAPGREATVTPL